MELPFNLLELPLYVFASQEMIDLGAG